MEHREQQRRGGERAKSRRRAPAAVWAIDDAEQEREDGCGKKGRTDQVEADGVPLTTRRDAHHRDSEQWR
jgi:hypothetical protein